MYKCPRILLRNSAVPYDTSRLRFPSHLLAASNSSPIRVRVLQQVRGSCSYVLCPHRQFRSFVCSQFYSLVLRPGTSACFFSLACLSFTVAGTPEHQCTLSVFVLVCSRRDAAAHQCSVWLLSYSVHIFLHPLSRASRHAATRLAETLHSVSFPPFYVTRWLSTVLLTATVSALLSHGLHHASTFTDTF